MYCSLQKLIGNIKLGDLQTQKYSVIFDKMSMAMAMPIITANIVPSTGANEQLSGIVNLIEKDDKHRDVSQRFLTLFGEGGGIVKSF